MIHHAPQICEDHTKIDDENEIEEDTITPQLHKLKAQHYYIFEYYHAEEEDYKY
jgi:hypothetical protein